MYKRVLLPVDLAQEASWREALPIVTLFCDGGRAELHLVSVVPEVGHSMVGQFLPTDYERQAVIRAEQGLNDLVENEFRGTPASTHVVTGSVYREIVETATRLDCDLIVLVSHQPDLVDFLLGAHAPYVVRHAHCSVHVIRS